MVFQPIHPFSSLTQVVEETLSDLEYLAIKEFDGKLIKSLSSEFTGNATQITITPASSKTFYHLRSKLYPVIDVIALPGGGVGNSVINRRADVELINDGIVIDVLTLQMQARQADADMGSSSVTSQLETNILDSLAGNGVKTMTLVSTNNSGTFRVSMIGILEDPGTSPKA